MNWEVWGPPIIVVTTGLVAGLFVALRSASGSSPEPRTGRVEDLQARKQALLEQLRGLDADRRKLSPEEFQQRWNRTLDRAARTLRDLDEAMAAPVEPAVEPAAAGTPAPAPAASSGNSRLAWGAASVAFFVLLGVTLSQTSNPRGASGSMTGGTGGGMSSSSSGSGQGAATSAAKAAFASNPQDLDAAATLAHAAIRSGDLQGGMQYVEAGRQVSPDDPRIQASLAALMIAIGYLDRAEQTLDVVNANAPELSTGWLWRGVLMMSKGDTAAAEAALTKAMQLSTDPEDKRLAAQLMQDLASAASMGAPSAAPQAAAATPAATGSARISGRAELVDGVQVPPGALVFIYARPSVEGRGPPLAALKLPASQLPLDFSISDADIIMKGMPWPDQVYLSARIDLDGNAATKEEGAPSAAAVGPYASGSEGISLQLR